MKYRGFAVTVVFVIWLIVSNCFAGESGGWFGFTINVDASIFSLNPVLRSATVVKVVAGSPAARGGVTAGDQIIQVEGVAIAGRRAKDIKPLMQKAAGETLHLQMKNTNGNIYSTSLVAQAKPQGGA
jgi:C-terminal processing protease CtpA/Prc